jgi:hypothetical protein
MHVCVSLHVYTTTLAAASVFPRGIVVGVPLLLLP